MSPATGALDLWDGTPAGDLEKIQKLAGAPWEGSSELVAPKTGQPRDNSGMQVSGSSSPVLIPPPFPFSSHPLPLFRFIIHLLFPLLIRTARHPRPQ